MEEAWQQPGTFLDLEQLQDIKHTDQPVDFLEMAPNYGDLSMCDLGTKNFTVQCTCDNKTPLNLPGLISTSVTNSLIIIPSLLITSLLVCGLLFTLHLFFKIVCLEFEHQIGQSIILVGE